MSSSSVETLSPRSTQDEDKMLCDILKKSKNEINIIIDNILLTIKDLKNIIHNVTISTYYYLYIKGVYVKSIHYIYCVFIV